MSKTSQALNDFKKLPKEYNYLKKEAKGLSFNAVEMIKRLKPYEVDFSHRRPKDIEDEWEFIEYLTENGKGKRYNSYNWGGEITFELAQFKYRDRNYIAIAYHICGDVRGNYTDFVFYDINGIEELYEVLDMVKEIKFTKGYYDIEVYNSYGNLFNEAGHINIEWTSHLKGEGSGSIDDVYFGGNLEDIDEIKKFAYDKVKEDIYEQMRG